MRNYHYEFLDKDYLFKAGVQASWALGKVINGENKCIFQEHTQRNGQVQTRSTLVSSLRFINRFLEGLDYWTTEEEFTRAFYAAWNLELKCAEARETSRFHSVIRYYKYNQMDIQTITPIKPYWFLKAYHMGLISRDILFKAVLNYFDRRGCLHAITQQVKGEYGRSANRKLWGYFFGGHMAVKILEQGRNWWAAAPGAAGLYRNFMMPSCP